MAPKSICSVPNCGKPREKRDWCGSHYERWLRHGDPTAGRIRRGEYARYFDEVVMPYEGDDCLIWPYSRNESGYGKLTYEGKVQIASRLVCEKANGPPPSSKHEAAHECGKGHLGCVSKRHLSWKTHAANQSDKRRHGTLMSGERHHNSKLREADVRAIRQMNRTRTHAQLAERFGVSKGTINDIVMGLTWKNVA